jgi:hypothetical protein
VKERRSGLSTTGKFKQGEAFVKVEQLSVFLENKSGRLADATDVLARNGINIRALSLADTADFGILRLIVDDSEKARMVLKEDGFTAAVTEVLAIEVPDKPGGLSGILKQFSAAGINVEYLYAFVARSRENAIIICRFENIDGARAALEKEGIRILNGADISVL